MVNAMLSDSNLSEGFWGEAMLTRCYILNRVPNKRNSTTKKSGFSDELFRRIFCSSELPMDCRRNIEKGEVADGIFDGI